VAFSATIDLDERGPCTVTGRPTYGWSCAGAGYRVEDIEAVDAQGEPVALTADEENRAEDALLAAIGRDDD
jgi:hypothetical protein